MVRARVIFITLLMLSLNIGVLHASAQGIQDDTLTSSQQQAGCPLTPRLAAGMQARVMPGLPNTLRTEPSSWASSLGKIPVGGVFTVINGPICGPEGWYFWYVSYNGLLGWTAEGNTIAYWLEPLGYNAPIPVSSACPLTPRLAAGMQARVMPGLPNTLRTEPRAWASSLGKIPVGGVFTVINGPICGPEGWYFWYVSYNGLLGWTAEGNTIDYWLEPLGYNTPIPVSSACPLTPRLAAGMQARITPGLPNTLRTEPRSSASSLGKIPEGGMFAVISGPVCGPEGWYFWYVSYNGLLGWTAEGNTISYWIEPLGLLASA